LRRRGTARRAAQRVGHAGQPSASGTPGGTARRARRAAQRVRRTSQAQRRGPRRTPREPPDRARTSTGRHPIASR